MSVTPYPVERAMVSPGGRQTKGRWLWDLLVGPAVLIAVGVWQRSLEWVPTLVVGTLLLFWSRMALRAYLARGHRHEVAIPSGLHIFETLLEQLQLTLILGLATLILIHGRFIGTHLRQAGYDLLRQCLVFSGHGESPVVVIDTSDLWTPYPPEELGPSGPVTPRKPILELIEKLTAPDQAGNLPRAIGVDVNFHPDAGGLYHPNDERFFRACLDAEARHPSPGPAGGPRGLKIALGVSTNAGLEPEHWLDSMHGRKYAGLAVSLAVPRVDVSQIETAAEVSRLAASDISHFFASIEPAHGEGTIPPPMAVVLARAYLAKTGEDWPQVEPLITICNEKDLRDPGLRIRSYLVDYGWLDQIRGRSRPLQDYLDPERGENLRSMLKDKIVLIGEVDRANITDSFFVPGNIDPVPGVFVQACAAATLAASPLYELNSEVATLADIALAVAVLVLLVVLRLGAKRRSRGRAPQEVHEATFPILFIVAILAAIFTSLLLVQARIFWLDILVVAFVLAVHPLFEWAGKTIRDFTLYVPRPKERSNGSHPSPTASP